MGNANKKTFIKQIPAPPKKPGEMENVDKVSASFIAIKGPFVDAKTGEQLRKFYGKYAPEKDESWINEHIQTILKSGMPIAELNELLQEKYKADLRDI
jgi:hypothetical protein